MSINLFTMAHSLLSECQGYTHGYFFGCNPLPVSIPFTFTNISTSSSPLIPSDVLALQYTIQRGTGQVLEYDLSGLPAQCTFI